MIISGTLAIIATTATIFGLVTSGANVAGTIHDKNMINESLQNMHETQQLLQEKAQKATGANKEEMLIAANKLKQVNSRMKELNNEAYTSALRNEAAGLAKGLLTSVAGADVAKLGDVANNAVGIGQTAADQVIGNQGLSNALGNAEMDRWKSATQAGDSLDVQILILQARELAKKTKNLDKDMQKMKDWYDNEKLGNTDSSQIDQMAVDLVVNNPDLAIDPVLAADMADTADTPPSDPTEPPVDRSDPKSGVGLDFLKDYGSNAYGKKVEMFYDFASLNFEDEEIDSRVITSIKRSWDSYGNDLSNMSINMTINEDNTVTGTMKGIAFVNYNGYTERIVDLKMDGKFNPKDKTFEGKMTGNLTSAADGVANGPTQTAMQFIKSLKHYETSEYKHKHFTFKGSVDEKTRTIYGNFFILHFWREMEGDY